jgi:hypothetical protein
MDRSTTLRPVQLPIGSFVKFTMELLSSTAEEQVRNNRYFIHVLLPILL